jgi:hypothetical protein
VVANLFERLAAGRVPEEPTPPPAPQATSPAVLKLLDWLQHTWDQPTICARDFYRHGPKYIRNRERALELTETLTKRGWLIPLKTHRYDRKKWQITIGPV